MSEVFKIHVTKGWIASPILKQITPSEWVIWLESIGRILGATENRLAKSTVEDLRTNAENELKLERERLAQEHKNAAEILVSTNKKLESQLAELKKSNDEALRHNEEILAERYGAEIKALRDTLSVFERKNDELLGQLGEAQKQTIKYFEDRKQELETFYRTNFFREQELLAKERQELLLERKKADAELRDREAELRDREAEMRISEAQIKESVAKTYEEQLALMAETIETLKQTGSWQQNMEQTFKEIQTTIQPIKKMYQGSNEEKGASGEKSIFDFIAEANYFADGLLKDTSNQAHYGDMHFIWRSMRCLIEVKNKKKIASTDIAKFENDIRYVRHNDKNPCNCALFIALTAAMMENRSREKVQVEIINGIPAIYIMVDRPEEIQPALILLEKVTSLERFDQKAITQKVTQHFLDYKLQTETLIKFLSDQINRRQKEIKDCTKQLNELYTSIEKINLDTSTFIGDIIAPDAKAEANGGAVESKAAKLSFDEVKKFYINSTLKTRKPIRLDIAQYFNVPIAEVDVLFTDEIEQKVCAEYLAEVISESICKRLAEYREKNNNWPTRTVLVKDYISDAQLRKLNKFFGADTMKIIWAHVIQTVKIKIS